MKKIIAFIKANIDFEICCTCLFLRPNTVKKKRASTILQKLYLYFMNYSLPIG